MKIHKFLLFIEAIDKSKRAQIPGKLSPNGEFRLGWMQCERSDCKIEQTVPKFKYSSTCFFQIVLPFLEMHVVFHKV